MNTRKQSFLERLTGAQIIDEPSTAQHPDENILNQSEIETTDVDSVQEIDEEFAEEEVEAGLAIDIYETDNELVIQSMIAGVTPENLQIAITRDLVTITGKRIAPGVPEGNYIERELYWGLFTREIQLPFEIDTEGAEAVEKYGLLIIRLPKLDKNRVQELKVKSI